LHAVSKFSVKPVPPDMSLPTVNVKLVERVDRRTLWEWRNDTVTAELFDTNTEIVYENFCRWVDRIIYSDTSLLIIGQFQSIRIGVAWSRKFKNGTWEVQVYIKPTFSGRQLGGPFVRSVAEYLINQKAASRIKAIVPNVNPASAYAYSAAGFNIVENGNNLSCTLLA
jgi:RimJ/RimL family protein N-acetyltransferase